jgi:hypothetical protein
VAASGLLRRNSKISKERSLARRTCQGSRLKFSELGARRDFAIQATAGAIAADALASRRNRAAPSVAVRRLTIQVIEIWGSTCLDQQAGAEGSFPMILHSTAQTGVSQSSRVRIWRKIRYPPGGLFTLMGQIGVTCRLLRRTRWRIASSPGQASGDLQTSALWSK